MSDEMKRCPTCECPYGYALRENVYACPECNHEWDAKEAEETTGLVVKDMNGKLLQNGDSVVVMKDLPVKGYLLYTTDSVDDQPCSYPVRCLTINKSIIHI